MRDESGLDSAGGGRRDGEHEITDQLRVADSQIRNDGQLKERRSHAPTAAVSDAS